MSTESSPAPAGRYAPSPSGPLHLGSLVAALGSFLQARSRGAHWYMRVEDLDPAREVRGAATDQLRTLEAHGVIWDGPVLYQSTRGPAYQHALDRLFADGAAFFCGCTRREALAGPAGIEGPIYPGTCRNGLPPGRQARTLRLRVDNTEISFDDGVFARVTQCLARDVGDFVVHRADRVAAYQLAVVLDDAFQGVTEVVRGADLLASTPRQLWLHDRLGLAPPQYWHLPVLITPGGAKLGKSTGAPPLDRLRPVATLLRALEILGQQPPRELAQARLQELIGWAVGNWDIGAVPRQRAVVVEQ